MTSSSRWILSAALLVSFTPFALAQQEQIFSNIDGGTGGNYVLGHIPGTSSSESVSFNFTVSHGPDVQLNEGEFLASLDPLAPGDSGSNRTVQILGSAGASSPLYTMSVNGLNDSPSLIHFTSNSQPLLAAGQQYSLAISMNDPSTTALWWTPSVTSHGRGAFALSCTPVDWQTHFTGSATIGGTGMQNAVMVFENFDANGNVLDKFVQPLGDFNPNQPITISPKL